MIEDTLNYLLDCYPAFEPKSQSFWVTWRKRLEGFDPDLVQKAAEVHVEERQGRFFPSLPELIRLVDELGGLRKMDTVRAVQDDLMALEEGCRESGDLERDAFERLAVRFERLGMPCNAEWARERFWRMAVQLGRAKVERLADAQQGRLAELAGMFEAMNGAAAG